MPADDAVPPPGPHAYGTPGPAPAAPAVAPFPYTTGTNTTAKRSTAATVGLVVAVLLAVSGVVIIGAIVVFFVALNSWGNNK